MSTVRICADTHFGHVNMAIKRGFNSVEEHDEHIIEQWNSVVHKRDMTYILGDITMEKKDSYPLLDRLNGRIIVVLGNHDKAQHIVELLNYVEAVSGMTKYKGIFLSHCPIHPREMEYRVPYNIHGHIHEHVVTMEGKTMDGSPVTVEDTRYICVSMEQIDYKPKTIGELIPNWDDADFRNNYLWELKKKIEAEKGKMFDNDVEN